MILPRLGGPLDYGTRIHAESSREPCVCKHRVENFCCCCCCCCSVAAAAAVIVRRWSHAGFFGDSRRSLLLLLGGCCCIDLLTRRSLVTRRFLSVLGPIITSRSFPWLQSWGWSFICTCNRRPGLIISQSESDLLGFLKGCCQCVCSGSERHSSIG